MRRHTFLPLLLIVALVSVACGARFEGPGTQAARTVTSVETVPGDQTEVPTTADDITGEEVAAPTDGPAAPGTVTTTRTRTVARSEAGQVSKGGVIKVGGIFPLTGGLSALGIPPERTARAYFRSVNDAGGVEGFTFDFETCDDRASDEQSQTCARDLVDRRGVFAMGPSFLPFAKPMTFIEDRGIPWLGHDGINIEAFGQTNVVSLGAPIQYMAHALIPYWYRQVEKKSGRAPNKIATIVLNQAPSLTYNTVLKKEICGVKLPCEVVYERIVGFEELNFATILTEIQQRGAEAVWIITDPATAVKVLVEARERAYKPFPGGFLCQHGCYMDLTTQQAGSAAEGMLANAALVPASADVPAINDMKKLVARYYSDISHGYWSVLAYASARLLVDVVAETARTGPMTRERIYETLQQFTSYDCHGLCKSVNLIPPMAAKGGNHNVWIVRAAGDTWLQDSQDAIDAWRTETWPRPGRP